MDRITYDITGGRTVVSTNFAADDALNPSNQNTCPICAEDCTAPSRRDPWSWVALVCGVLLIVGAGWAMFNGGMQ